MEIQWLGHACFKITHKGYSVVIDPYNSRYVPGYPVLKTAADKLLISHEHYGHNFREGVKLSGRPERDCPFEIKTCRVDHDSVGGIMRGTCLVHLLEADGIRIAHMGDIGVTPHGQMIGELFGLDAMMITAGSDTGLPAQEVWRLSESLLPKVLIPMHYRFGNHGCRRLEHIEALTDLFDAPDLIKNYNTDTITVDADSEPQVALLKYLGK